jgi:hypothetical protein
MFHDYWKIAEIVAVVKTIDAPTNENGDSMPFSGLLFS